MSESFGSRWSRLKRENSAGVAETEVAPKVESAVATAAIDPAVQNADEQSRVAELPAIETLTAESDFTAFMQPKVPDALKRQALKKLFADPHFNTMDGLDVYIDDYNVFTPIPEDWYKDIPSWQKILNPQMAIVTDKGYAVEPDSEEGKAYLAAQEAKRLETASTETTESAPKGQKSEQEPTVAIDSTIEIEAQDQPNEAQPQ